MHTLLSRWTIGLLSLCLLLPLAAQAQTNQKPAATTVAIWDFDNHTVAQLSQLGQQDYLRRSLAQMLLTTLIDIPGIKLVDRQQLREVLQEQKLTSGELADEDARLRLGRILGAEQMIFGQFLILGERIQVSIRSVDSATSQVLFADEFDAPASTVLAEAGKTASRLAKALSGKPAPLNHSTQNSDTALWLAYDQALELADAGNFDAAIEHLKALLRQNKDFLAAERLLVSLLEKQARQ